MAGPGGIEAGRASLKVLPDLSQFTRSLQRFITRIERQVVVELPTQLDMHGVQESIKSTQERVKASPARMPVEPDTDDFGKRALADVKKATARIEADIPLTADGERLRRDVAVKVAALQEQIRQFAVEVPLDAGQAASARAEIRAKVAEIQAMVRADPVEIPVEVDRSQIRDVAFALNAIRLPNVGGFSKGTGLAGLGILAAGTVPQLLSLTGSLTQVSGAAALLPAVGAAAAASVAGLAVGLHGVGDALKNMGHPEKFAASLKKLAPNARDAVRAIKGLGPAFRGLRLKVQDRLFADVAETIQSLATRYLPVLRDGLSKVATASSEAFGWVADALQAPGVVKSISSVMSSTSGAVSGFGRAFAFLTPALATLAAVGSSFLPGLARGFASLSQDFAAFIDYVARSGELKDFIQGGLDALGDLVKIGVNAAGAVGGIVKAAQAAGGGTLATLATVLADISNAINSPAFQKGLTAFFSGVQDGASGLLSSALPAIGDLFAELGPVLADFARKAGPAIGDIIAALAPVAGELAKALGPAFADVLRAVADIIIDIAPTLEDWAKSLQDVNPLLLGLAGVALALLPTLGGIAGNLVGAVAGFAELAGVFAEGGLLAGIGAVAAPILAVVAVIAALAAGFYLVYQNSQPVRDAVAQLMGAFSQMWAVVQPILDQLLGVVRENMPQIRAIVQQAWSTIQTVIVTVLNLVRAHIMAVTAIIKGVWAIFGDTIMAVVRVAFGTVLGVIRGALNVIQGIFRTIGALLRGDWSGVWDGIKQTVSGAWDIIKSVIGGGLKASVALVEGIGAKMLHAGQYLIQSLVDGISSRIQAVKNKVGEVADSITGFFHGSPVKEGPLKQHGWNEDRPGKLLADSLADGMLSGQSSVRDASRQLAGAVVSPDGSGVSGSVGSGLDLSESTMQRLRGILGEKPLTAEVAAGSLDSAMAVGLP